MSDMVFRKLLARIGAASLILGMLSAQAAAQFGMGGGGAGAGGGGMGRGAMSQIPKSKEGDKPVKKLVKLPSWLGGPDEPLAKKLYQEGNEIYKQARDASAAVLNQPAEQQAAAKEAATALYVQAAGKFSSAAKRAEDFPIEEDARFMLAESYFFADQYPKSSDQFALLFKKFPNSRYTQQAVAHQFLIARYWEQMNKFKPKWPVTPNVTDGTRPHFDDNGNALAIYQSIQSNDPTGPLADDAAMATANAYYLDGKYDEASHYYARLRKEHPRSEHQPKAHLLGLRSEMLRYQGPKYDGAPLKEVEKLARASYTQFPQELADERENILRVQETVRAQRAQRDYEMAEYYRNTQHYRAARFYYDLILKDHSDTQFAVLARQRLGEIQGKPDVPPTKFPWLIKMFETKRAQF
jgi:outer membrane protein assembly factor BamD (BamD/ComL family)